MSLIGNLEDLELGDILQIVSLSGRSGVLYLTREGEEGKVVFIDGQIISASSSAQPNHILRLLKIKDLLHDKEFKELYARLKERSIEDMEAFLVQLNIIDEMTLQNIIRNYVNEVVLGFFLWSEGNFVFDIKDDLKTSYTPGFEGYLKTPLNPQYIVLEGSGKLDEKKRDEKSAGGAAHKPGGQGAEKARPETGSGERFIVDMTEELKTQFQNEVELLPDARGRRVEVSPGLLTLKSMINELMNPDFTGEITLLIMRFASELLNRGILFVAARNKLIGLGQFGLEAFLDNPNVVVKKMRIEVEKRSLLGKVMDRKAPVKEAPERTEDNGRLIARMGGGWPAESYAIPLVTAGRVAAVFYGDNVPLNRSIPDMTAFEIFMTQAGVVMEKTYLERMLRDRKDVP